MEEVDVGFSGVYFQNIHSEFCAKLPPFNAVAVKLVPENFPPGREISIRTFEIFPPVRRTSDGRRPSNGRPTVVGRPSDSAVGRRTAVRQCRRKNFRLAVRNFSARPTSVGRPHDSAIRRSRSSLEQVFQRPQRLNCTSGGPRRRAACLLRSLKQVVVIVTLVSRIEVRTSDTSLYLQVGM